jgi:KUP system potassium uptake protein
MEKTRPTPHKIPDGHAGDRNRLMRLSLAALGVVFGDIATSPIYALRECFYGDYGIPVTHDNILGALSLVIWSLIIIVGLKYLVYVFRADNRGEGGVLALTALVRGQSMFLRKGKGIGVVALGLFAACLLYGDGMITPAISVLSAVEGIRIITPALKPYVIPLTILILFGLFIIQHHGTERVGGLFGPVILVWLSFLAVTGLVQVVRTPRILMAVMPWYALKFFIINRLDGFVALGAVFLVVTGTEALYADMGHFGTRPIRLTWFGIVFPALVLNYLGQGALLLIHPEAAHHPFYSLIPSWGTIPAVLLATLATIIASQAVISGAFSLTRQSVQLGYLPRLSIKHTSAAQIGQIYVGPVNWMLMICTIALVLGFHTSSRLAAAYGVAVSSTMLITTFLFYIVSRQRWHWSRLGAGLLCGLFIVVDTPFFAANMAKISHGAWFPLGIAAVLLIIMLTWVRGRSILGDQLRHKMPPMQQFIKSLAENPPARIGGNAIFLTGNPGTVPVALAKNVKHNRVIHRRTILMHLRVEDVPRIPNLDKVKTDKLGRCFYSMTVRYGFMERFQLDTALTLAKAQGLDVDPRTTSFFIGRENLVLGPNPQMGRWRTHIFSFMSRNATDAAQFFNLPVDQIVEVGIQLKI